MIRNAHRYVLVEQPASEQASGPLDSIAADCHAVGRWDVRAERRYVADHWNDLLGFVPSEDAGTTITIVA